MAKKKSLHAILGVGGRVRKRTTPATPRAPRAAASSSAAPSSSSSAPPPPPPPLPPPQPPSPSDPASDPDTEDPPALTYFSDTLSDHGLSHALATDLSLRSVAQAMGISRARMFAPVPEKGLRSARVPALHARRATVPPLTTRAHLAGMLAAAEPAQTERELAELVREGVVRRVAVARAPEVVELLVLERDLEGMLAEGVARGALGEDVRAEFAAWLRDSPGESVVAPGALSEHAADALVREGFLTAQGYAHLAARGERERLRTRPDERGSIVSLDRIARAASGSDAAVGGRAALYEAGGGGPSSGRTPQKPGRGGQLLSSPPAAPRTTHPLDLAVPGQGPFLRLATAAVAHLVSLIQTRSRFAQAPESTLREWWDCATPPESRAAASARRRRRRQNSTAPLASATTTTTTIAGRAWTRPPGSYVGDVMPDRTTKWRLLDGIRFEWALEEAVGCGAVEVFDAGAVGKGVRVV